MASQFLTAGCLLGTAVMVALGTIKVFHSMLDFRNGAPCADFSRLIVFCQRIFPFFGIYYLLFTSLQRRRPGIKPLCFSAAQRARLRTSSAADRIRKHSVRTINSVLARPYKLRHEHCIETCATAVKAKAQLQFSCSEMTETSMPDGAM